jgi:cysteinyl-tRNA synthetase, unknown class
MIIKSLQRFTMKAQKIYILKRYFQFFLCLLFIMCTEDLENNNDEEIDFSKIEMASAFFGDVKVTTWMYQIQNLDEKENINKLDDTEYDMLVVEPGFNFSEDSYDTEYLVQHLKNKPGGSKRILLAYIDIGQAENYRDYWAENWVAPTSTSIGSPDFLITIDPDGWSGNYPVAYWDKSWQDLWIGDTGIIKKIAGYGFDGVYLDWVEAYDDDKVRAVAEEQKLNPEYEMLVFIEKIRNKGRSINPDFYVIAQNAQYLIDEDPEYYKSVIDAIATEDTWFYGKGDAEWDSPDAGDLTGGERHSEDYTISERIARNKKYLQNGIPVFTVDYCISEENAEQTYYNSWKNGFIPVVTRVSLSDITETPPYKYMENNH